LIEIMVRATGLAAVFATAWALGLVAVTVVPRSARAASPEAESDPPIRRPAAPGASFGAQAQAQSEALRRRDIDDMRRQDAAAALGRLGTPVAWQEHALRELQDWRMRAEAAEALRTEHGVTVDWRQLSLDRLLDMRVRAAKAAEISAAFGVAVDWQLWSWVELEAMRRTLERMGGRSVGADTHEAGAETKAIPTPCWSRGSRPASRREAVTAPTIC
jgi:hypothetical protein